MAVMKIVVLDGHAIPDKVAMIAAFPPDRILGLSDFIPDLNLFIMKGVKSRVPLRREGLADSARDLLIHGGGGSGYPAWPRPSDKSQSRSRNLGQVSSGHTPGAESVHSKAAPLVTMILGYFIESTSSLYSLAVFRPVRDRSQPAISSE
jgi:hypothetical protein